MPEKRAVVDTKTQELFNFNTILLNGSNENYGEKLSNSIMFNESKISELMVQNDTELNDQFESKEFEIAIQANNVSTLSHLFAVSSQAPTNGNENGSFYEDIIRLVWL